MIEKFGGGLVVGGWQTKFSVELRSSSLSFEPDLGPGPYLDNKIQGNLLSLLFAVKINLRTSLTRLDGFFDN